MEELHADPLAQWSGGKSRRKIGLVGGFRDFGVSGPSGKKAAQVLAPSSGFRVCHRVACTLDFFEGSQKCRG
jgi:hypothetical protein